MAWLRTWSIGIALTLGFSLTLGLPVWVVREWLRGPGWDPQKVEALFVSLRADNDALVFSYELRNSGNRTAHLPQQGRLYTLQAKGQPLLGYPAIRMPLAVAPYSSERVEVRMELAGPWDLNSGSAPGMGSSQFLPSPSQSRTATLELFEQALQKLDGFELVDPDRGLHLVFPRGW